MYPIVLALHSWNRWLVVLALLGAWALACAGWAGGRRYGPADRWLGGVLAAALHTQLLLGMGLYFALSPWTQLAFRGGWAAAWHDPTLRFWSVQHAGLMFGGVVVAQLGRSVAKRAATDRARHRAAALAYSLALGLLLLGIPFASRPWFRT